MRQSAMETANQQGLLSDWRSGDNQARDQLFSLLYAELEKISRALLRREDDISLSTGDLVNEAALRLINLQSMTFNDRAHFLAFASNIMRQVLIDHARKKKAFKRQHQKVTLLPEKGADPSLEVNFRNLEVALTRLSIIDPERSNIVTMRYFGGLSVEEIAEVTGLSASTVKRNWRASRAWLLHNMKEDLSL